MKRIIVIGCPGSGKSTFSRELKKTTSLPLHHLDLLYHKPDKTTVTKQEFDQKLCGILGGSQWIIDGNYVRTLEMRLAACDTVFWLDYPTEVCIQGIQSRIGKKRDDMPWVEESMDEEFLKFVISFSSTQRPLIIDALSRTENKTIFIFKSRDEADCFLRELQQE